MVTIGPKTLRRGILVYPAHDEVAGYDLVAGEHEAVFSSGCLKTYPAPLGSHKN
jgi:hypothetical protein